MQIVGFGQLRIEQLPELLVDLRTAVAPPEPCGAVAVSAVIALRLMERAEDDRHTGILHASELLREHLDSRVKILPFLGILFQDVGGIERAVGRLIVLVGALLPVHRVAERIACKVDRHIEMPACSRDAVAFLAPLDHALRGIVVPAVQRIIVHEIESADDRQFACGLLEVIEFILIIAVMAAAVDLLLAGDDALAVVVGQELHECLCLCGRLRITRHRRDLHLRHLCIAEGHGIVEDVAPASGRADLDRVLSLRDIEESEADICPRIGLLNIDLRGLFTVHGKILQPVAEVA